MADQVRGGGSGRMNRCRAKIPGKLIYNPLPLICSHLNGREACGMVVCNPVIKRQGISLFGNDPQSGTSGSRLFVRHSDCAVEGGPCVSIAGIEQVKHLSGKEQPSPFIKVSGMIGPHHVLKFTLP